MALMSQMGQSDAEGGTPPENPQAQPSGSSPAAQPAANAGMEAAARAMAAPIVRQMEMMLVKAGSGSDFGAALLKAISSLSKFAAPAEASPGIAMNASQNILNRQRQEIPMIAALRQQGQPSRPVQAPPQAGA